MIAPIPVILDTDIGTDIDDTWALLQLLRCPELDPRLILTATGDVAFRAAVTAKFLETAGRTEIPLGLGVTGGHTPPDMRTQEPWVKDYDLARYPGEFVEDGIGRLIHIVEQSPTPVTLLAIGPSGNLAAALARAPHIAARCRLVGMFGSFEIGYSGAAPAVAETNVRENPAALRAVLSAPWLDVLLTPLDTCNFALLDGEHYQHIWRAAPADPALRALLENYFVFAPRASFIPKLPSFTQRSTILFDCVAVYLAYAEDLVETETISFRITDDGFTVRDPTGPHTARVALRWKDLEAFHAHLTSRLLGAPHLAGLNFSP